MGDIVTVDSPVLVTKLRLILDSEFHTVHQNYWSEDSSRRAGGLLFVDLSIQAVTILHHSMTYLYLDQMNLKSAPSCWKRVVNETAHSSFWEFKKRFIERRKVCRIILQVAYTRVNIE